MVAAIVTTIAITVEQMLAIISVVMRRLATIVRLVEPTVAR